MMFQLLKDTKTGQYVQSLTGWYHGWSIRSTPIYQGLSNMFVNALQAQGIHLMANLPLTNLGLSKK